MIDVSRLKATTANAMAEKEKAARRMAESMFDANLPDIEARIEGAASEGKSRCFISTPSTLDPLGRDCYCSLVATWASKNQLSHEAAIDGVSVRW